MLVARYDASLLSLDDGDPVSAWADASGNENDATAGNAPTFRTDQSPTGKPGVDFDGAADYLTLPNSTLPTGSGQYTLYAVVRTRQESNEQGVFLFGGVGSTNQALSLKVHTSYRLNTGWWANNLLSDNNVVQKNVPALISSRWDGTDREQWVNGEAAGADQPGAVKNTGAVRNVIGVQNHGVGDFELWWDGTIFEILIYDEAHDDSERAAIEQQLLEKWMLPPAPTVTAPSESEEVESPYVVQWTPPGATPALRFGVFTDLHNSDKDTAINRYYRDAPAKMADAVAYFNELDLDFVLFLGDLIDHAGQDKPQAEYDLAVIEAAYAELVHPRYYALGNHDLDQLSKAEFIAATGMEEAYYSFEVGGTKIIVLDACYSADDDDASYNAGNFDYQDTYVPPTQRAWLEYELSIASGDVIVFCHQLLSGAGNPLHTVVNAAAVREILESAGNVRCVFSGHTHANDYDVVNGITYVALQAMTEGAHPLNAYAAVLDPGGSDPVQVHGFNQQDSYDEPLGAASYANGEYREKDGSSWSAIPGFDAVREPAGFTWDLSGLTAGDYEVRVGRHMGGTSPVAWSEPQSFTLAEGSSIDSSEIDSSDIDDSSDGPCVPGLRRTALGLLARFDSSDEEHPFSLDDWDPTRPGSLSIVDDQLRITDNDDGPVYVRCTAVEPANGFYVYLRAGELTTGGSIGILPFLVDVDNNIRMTGPIGFTGVDGLREWFGGAQLQAETESFTLSRFAPFHGWAYSEGGTAGGRAQVLTIFREFELSDITTPSAPGYPGIYHSSGSNNRCDVDVFFVARSRYLTVEDLQPGQKVQVMSGSDTVEKEATANGAGVARVDYWLEEYDAQWETWWLRITENDGTTVIDSITPAEGVWPGDEYAMECPSEPDSSEPEPEPAARFIVQTECGTCLLAIGEYPTLTVRFQIARADDPTFASPVYDSGFGPGDGTDEDGNVFKLVENLEAGHYLARIHAQTIFEPDAISPAMPFTILDLSPLFLGGWRSGV